MAYATKEIDHEKRKNQEGSYSVYNHIYHYLLDNYEPKQLESSFAAEAAENLLVKEGIAYCKKGGLNCSPENMRGVARNAITNFCHNNGRHGDTAHNLGKAQENSINSIANTVRDLRW